MRECLSGASTYGEIDGCGSKPTSPAYPDEDSVAEVGTLLTPLGVDAESLTDEGTAMEDGPDLPDDDGTQRKINSSLETETNDDPFEGIISDDTIGLYFKEIWSIPQLTREEEVDLAKLIELGEDAKIKLNQEDNALDPAEREHLEAAIQQGQDSLKILVKSNSRLVVTIAKNYAGQGLPFLDLIQEGNIGLMRAAKKFDYRKGNKFATYATWWVRQAITRGLANQSRTIRVPIHMHNSIRIVRWITEELEKKLGRQPTLQEIVEGTGLPPSKIQLALRASQQPYSLDRPVGESGETEFGGLIEDNNSQSLFDATAQVALVEDLREILTTLTPREASILTLRYGLSGEKPQTFSEIGKKFGLTRERIRQIEQEALNKLRKTIRVNKLRSYLY